MTETEANLLTELHVYQQQETHDIINGLPDDRFTAACVCGWESPLYWDEGWQAHRDWQGHVAAQTQPIESYQVRTMRVVESWATVKATSPSQAKRIIMADAGRVEPLADDPEFEDVGGYAFPQPMDELAFWIDDVQKGE